MKGEKFLHIVILVLCAVVASYAIFAVARSSGQSYTTYKAVYYEVGDGITTSGFVVRSEEPVYGADGIVVLTRSEGEKVGKGQKVADVFRDRTAQQQAEQIARKEAELKELEAAYSYATSGASTGGLDSDIVRLTADVAVRAGRAEYDLASDSADQLKSFVLRRYVTAADSEAIWKRITQAREELNTLYANAGGESGHILAEKSGYFSGVADGLEEELTPEFLEFASVEEYQNYRDRPHRETDAIGKLVTSDRWYYATEVNSVDVKELMVGDQIVVSFAYDFRENVRMRIDRISAAEGGKCLLVLSSSQYIQSAVSARSQTARLIFDNKSGLRIPKQAMHPNEEGESGVYVLVGAKAKWKRVNIIYDDGDSYIVELDESNTNNLRLEDEIILTKEKLFDGKVMKK